MGGGISTLNMLIILWNDLFLISLSVIIVLLFWKYRIVLYLNGGVSFKPVMQHCIPFLKINSCGVPTLNMFIIFVNWSRSICAILNIYLFWKNISVPLWAFVHGLGLSCTTAFNSRKINWCGVPTLTRIIILANSSISLVGVYALKMSHILQQRSMLYFNFGVRFDSVMHHCVRFSKKIDVGFQPWTG